jgi:hypothetical protein
MSGVWNSFKRGSRTIGTWFGVPKHNSFYSKTGITTDKVDRRQKRSKRRDKRRQLDLPEDTEALGKAGRRSLDAQRARGGRLSTILSDNSERLGG